MTRKNGGDAIAGSKVVSSDIKVKVAWLYHVEGLTQEQIAEKLGISRVKVMRTLAACVDEGVVLTRINASTSGQISLERQLEDRWGLRSAIVIPTPADPSHLERSVGHAVAHYLDETIEEGMTLAIGGGATLYASLSFLGRRQLNAGSVIGLVGCLPHSRWINPSIVAARVADIFGIDSYQLTAPVVVHDRLLRDLLWKQGELMDVQKRAAKADIALLTVGEMAPDATIFRYEIVSPSLLETLSAKGAVANILCYFVDKDGQLVDHEVNRRIMAIDLETVASIPEVVLAAGGRQKVPAIKAALKAMKPALLITDSDTASRLIE